MDVRQATRADLPEVERLCMATFATSVWRGVPPETQLRLRVSLWTTGRALEGLLVGVEADRVVGSITVATAETALRPSRRHLSLLRELGLLRMLRFLVLWSLTRYEPAPDEAYLHSVAVAPEHRRRSVGRHLMLAAEALARQWGKRVASVVVERTNTPSLRLMESLQYRFVDSRRSVVRAHKAL